MVPMYHLITLNHMMATICKIIISPIFPITFFVCLAVRPPAPVCLCYDAFARLQIILDPQQPLTLAISAAATKPQGGVWQFGISLLFRFYLKVLKA